MATGKTCPECGVTLPVGALAGLCPACLLKQGTETATAEAVVFDAPDVEEVRRLFPQLEVIELLGKGGMGAVYKARQPALDRFVALKLLPLEGPHGPAFAERFNREARALARLTHSNIVAVHDFGQVRGFAFFVMELVDGLNLRELERAGRLSPREALKIVPQICEALQFAHDEGIVHRDIKPENILLDKRGRVKIADFGIAKIMGKEAGAGATETQQAIGTPHYMAPEQVEKPETVDHRADIYSLGVVFYEMLTDELPLGKFAPPSRKVEVDVRLDQVVLRALEKEPDRRYQKASQVKTDVESIEMRRTPAVPAAQESAGHRVLRVMGWAFVFFIAGVAIWVGVYFLVRAKPIPAAQLSQEGWQLWQARRFGEAIPKFQQAVKLAPNDANAWNGLGWANFNSGKPSGAEQAFLKCLELQPGHPAALNGLGQIYLTQRKYDLAETHLRGAAVQAPAAWYGLARLYLLQDKFAQAEEWAQKVVDSGQGDATAQKMLEAAKAKQVPEGLRLMIDPPSPAPGEAPGVDSLPPVVVSTDPPSGARDVPPGPTKIRVRFSKPMAPRSWSWSLAWSNSAPDLIDSLSFEPDERTCVMLIQLEPGRAYGFWLNSETRQNFKDTQGRPAVPYLLIFETKQDQSARPKAGPVGPPHAIFESKPEQK